MGESEENDGGGSEHLGDTVQRRPELPTHLDDPLGAKADSEAFEDVDPTNLFSQTNLFSGLTSEEVREIVRVSTHRTLQAGDVLFRQGERAEALYMIEGGEFEVRSSGELGDEIVLAHLGPGSVVGEMAILEGGLRSATVEALAECSIFELSREAFTALREKRRHAAYKLILNLAATLGERRRHADARVFEVFEDPAQHIDLFEGQVHDLIARMRKA